LAQQRTLPENPVLSSSGRPSLAVRPAPGPAPSPALIPAAGAPAVGAPSVDARWVRRTASAAGIPEVAVAAYARAVLGAPSGCGLGWTTLAGIGWVESAHGTVGGRSLDASGRPSTPIVGPALDGAGPVAAIHATASSARLHGDPEWDHAVGPLQFLPSTWETWARDGDGDGTADPQDLDDAAAAAAAYLCGTGYDLSSGPGWSAAVYAYNHSASYVSGVYLAATTYASRAAG
ncbi:MAG TPA: lytic murein transglycosylase, partial [Nocardioides sp.]|nr:lytic murein transglycosylase [Nocardioides sp.]